MLQLVEQYGEQVQWQSEIRHEAIRFPPMEKMIADYQVREWGWLGSQSRKGEHTNVRRDVFHRLHDPHGGDFAFGAIFIEELVLNLNFLLFLFFFFAHFSFFLPVSLGFLSKYANASNPVFPGPLNFMNCDRTPPYLDTKFTNRGVAKMYISDKNSPYRDVFYRLHGPDG